VETPFLASSVVADPTDIESVRELLRRKRSELIATYAATGVAIGKREPADQAYVLVVYLASRSMMPAEPHSLEGIPLKFEVTGRFRPL
jgi:hypothetical protein